MKATRRLRRLRLTAPSPVPARRLPARLVALLAGIAIALLVGGWYGPPAGLLAAFALDRVLRRLETRRARTTRLRAEFDLPYAADLLAASLRAGAPVDAAAIAVGTALAGPVGARLCRVGSALRLGATSAEAWAELTAPLTPADWHPAATVPDTSADSLAVPADRSAVTTPAKRRAVAGTNAGRSGAKTGGGRSGGGPARRPIAGSERLAALAVRSSHSGAALAANLTRLADDLRGARAAALDAAARRAGVLVVLPLGLCFLPAFVLAGLVPVVVAVLGDVLP